MQDADMTKGKEAGRIQVYVRVRPFTDKEKEKRETDAIQIHHDHSLIRVLDPRRETNYFFDGVFGPEASNQELYLKVGRPLVYAALNGYKGTLLTYGQTGTGKTYTLLSDDGVTTRVVSHCFERIQGDEIHNYKVTCSFLQVYQEKVYDLLNTRFTAELPVREHPKRGVYVANLMQSEVKTANDVLALLEFGKRQLVMADTKMVRHSSRSHSIMQLIIERRLKAHISIEKAAGMRDLSSPESVHESIMALDETINNLLKELKQDRKTQHRRERECLKELMEKEMDDQHSFQGDVIVKGKINLCDLAGSERLTKTKAEGVRLTEAKYLNTSLLELGNVIHALARGNKRHVPYRNSTLTRLLQDCLGDNGKTNFIVCIAPSLSEVNETKCSLNFGLRAMRIINVARLNVEVDYKVLAERLAKKLEDQDRSHKLEKLEYLREIQRLNSAVTSYEENEHVVNGDTDTLVSVIQNLSKSVQREKEEKFCLQSELTCLKRQVSQSPTSNAPELEALFLAELMSLQLLSHVHQSEAAWNAVRGSDLPDKVKEYMSSNNTQEAILMSTGYMLQLIDTCLGFHDDGKEIAMLSPEKSLRQEVRNDVPYKPMEDTKEEEPPSSPRKNHSFQGVTGGIKKMLGKLVGRDPWDMWTHKSPGSAAEEESGLQPENYQVEKREIQNRPEKSENVRSSTKGPCGTPVCLTTQELMRNLSYTKQKVERHIANLLLSSFGEQLVCNQGNSPQWGILGKKLSELIMFKRNNMIGINDFELWCNYEDMVSMLESCFKYVLMDKALLASMVVIEHMNYDFKTAKSEHMSLARLPSNLCRSPKTSVNDSSTSNEDEKKNTAAKTSDAEIGQTHKGEFSKGKPPKKHETPSKERIQSLKENKTRLEQEIGDVCDDTSRLETELFATMEEKTRLEDELGVMKDYVNRLKMEMFHLKIERGNLESDVKKTAANLLAFPDQGRRITGDLPKEGDVSRHAEEDRIIRLGELSDVPEASRESLNTESENGSQFSDTNEKEAAFRNCLKTMSKMYTLVPNPDEDTLTEGDGSDEKEEHSLSDHSVDESDDDDDIIITKIAREMRDYHSPSKRSRPTTPTSRGEEETRTLSRSNSLKDPKADMGLKELQVAYEDLEDELYNVGEELSKAQKINLELEAQLTEEKDSCDQVRKLYMDIKDTNYVLEGKVAILRDELEKSLRENTFLKEYSRAEVLELSLGGHQKPEGKLYSKSTAKPLSKKQISDLQRLPSTQSGQREAQIIKLLEENSEIKSRIERLVQERTVVEQQNKEKSIRFDNMEMTLQENSKEKKALQDKILLLQQQKALMDDEIVGRKEVAAIHTTELELYIQQTAKMEKQLIESKLLREKLEAENKKLRRDFEVVEIEVKKWKENNIKPTSRSQEDMSAKYKPTEKSFQMVFVDDDLMDSSEGEKTPTGEDVKGLIDKLQRELGCMSQYQEVLEKDYADAKAESAKLKLDLGEREERIKRLEAAIESSLLSGSLSNSPSPSKSRSYKSSGDCHKEFVLNESILKLEEEVAALKSENNDLRQQITKANERIAIYESDLEQAMAKIAKLQEDIIAEEKGEGNNATGENDGSQDMEEKSKKAEEEIEKLRESLVDKEAEKRLLVDELGCLRRRKEELEEALEESRNKNRVLENEVELGKECARDGKAMKELAEKNQSMTQRLKACDEALQSAKKKLQKQHSDMKKLEDDLVQTSSEKLKVEFELRNATGSIGKLRNDLEQSESDRKLLATDLKDKIEKAADLEIQLMEARCTNDCLRNEVDQLREQKRQESHQTNEISICKETLEKRLQEAFKTNNQLQTEVQDRRSQNKDLEERLQFVSESKERAEGELENLKKRSQELEVELENTATEKNDLEGKTKRLEDMKKKMEEDVWKLRSKINVLTSDLTKIEKQQEEADKKCGSLEKEIKRKTKELESKQRENRKLRKELSSKDEKTFSSDNAPIQWTGNSTKRLKEKIELLEKQNVTLSKQLVDKDNGPSTDNSNVIETNTNSKESNLNNGKRVSFAKLDEDSLEEVPVLEQVGWDFENDTLIHETPREKETLLKASLNEGEETPESGKIKGMDVSTKRPQQHEERGWDFNNHSVIESNENQQLGDSNDDKDDEKATASLLGMAQMSKEKLLLEKSTCTILESKTAYLTKEQMRLQNSLSKALEENQKMAEKLTGTERLLEIAQDQMKELEKLNMKKKDVFQAATQTDEMRNSKETLVTSPSSESSSAEDENKTEKGHLESKAPDKVGTRGSNSKVIVLLTREKKQIAKELEGLKNQHASLHKELADRKAFIEKLQVELKLVTDSYTEEKQMLLSEIYIAKQESDRHKAKLKELETHQVIINDLKTKNEEAEKLVTELENDLVRQTKEKNDLTNELIKSQTEVKQLKNIENELQTMRNENELLAADSENMGKKLEELKRENGELLDRLTRRKQSSLRSYKTKSLKTKAAEKADKKEDDKGKKGSDGDAKKNGKSASEEDKSNRRHTIEVNNQNILENSATIGKSVTKNIKPTRDTTGTSITDGAKREKVRTVAVNASETLEESHESANKDIDASCKLNAEDDSKVSLKGQKYEGEIELTTTNGDNSGNSSNDSENESTSDELGSNVEKVKDDRIGESDKEDSHPEQLRSRDELNDDLSNQQHVTRQSHNDAPEPQPLALNREKQNEDIQPSEYKDHGRSDRSEGTSTCGHDDEHDCANEEKDVADRLQKILRERESMEREVEAMMMEMSSLRSKIAALQDEHENNPVKGTEKLLEELDTFAAQNSKLQDDVKELKTNNARIEIELSDAVEVKTALEEEILRLREQLHEMEFHGNNKIAEVEDRYSKMETVLSYVLEENSRLDKEMTTIRDENKMLKNFNILEVVDGSTQMSPTSLEENTQTSFSIAEENKDTAVHDVTDRWDETPLFNVSSPGLFHNEIKSDEVMTHLDDRPLPKLLELPLKTGSMSRYPSPTTPDSKPLSASSPDVQGSRNSADNTSRVPDLRAATDDQGRNLQEYYFVQDNSEDHAPVTPESEPEFVEETRSRKVVDSNKHEPGKRACRKCLMKDCQCEVRDKAAAKTPKAVSPSPDIPGVETEAMNADVFTDSSFASVTDLEDMSFTSDWQSSEEVTSGRRNPVFGSHMRNKMHRELAEMKCTNTILENEVSIFKNRNSDLQVQLQKISGRNNSLKQKICDKSLAAKKAERELGSIMEEKTRLEIRVSASKEEIAKLEKDRSKLERNLSSSKTDNKRLKSELMAVKAENYKNMKALVNLEAENKRLQTEVEQTREELKRTKELFMNGTLDSLTGSHKVLSELPQWFRETRNPSAESSRVLSLSHNELADRKNVCENNGTPSQTSPIHPGERVASDQGLNRHHSSESDEYDNKGKLRTRSQSFASSAGDISPSNASALSDPSRAPSQSSYLSDQTRPPSQTSLLSESGRSTGQMSYDSALSFPERDLNTSEGSADSGNQDAKSKSGIKKMFKKLSKSKKSKLSPT